MYINWLKKKKKNQTLWLLFIKQYINSNHKSHKRVPKKYPNAKCRRATFNTKKKNFYGLEEEVLVGHFLFLLFSVWLFSCALLWTVEWFLTFFTYFDICVWKYVFCCLKTCVKIRVNKKMYENTYNIV